MHIPVSAPLAPWQYSLALLLATIHIHSSGILAGEESHTTIPSASERYPNSKIDGDDPNGVGEDRPAKRQRAIQCSALASLGQVAATSPASACPVAATLLLQYGLIVPEREHCEWARQVAGVLPQAMETGCTQDGRKTGALLWLLRYIHALTLAAPSTSKEDSRSYDERLDFIADIERPQRIWEEIWRTLVTGVHSLTQQKVPTPEIEAALHAIASIAHRKLFRLPQTAHTLWSVPLLESQGDFLSPAGVSLITESLRATAHSTIRSYEMEHKLLECLGHRDVVGNAACDVASAMEAFLRLRVPSTIASSCCIQDSSRPVNFQVRRGDAPSWVWWMADSAAEDRFAELTRGKLLSLPFPQIYLPCEYVFPGARIFLFILKTHVSAFIA